jgi:hypothetical protein
MNERSASQMKIEKPANTRIKMGLLAAAALAFFILFGIWSGVPTGENAQVFWIGVAVLLIVLTFFAWAVWYLLFSPLPDGQVHALPIPAIYFQELALLLAVGQFGVLIGAFWDEIWHRQYGIPFGEDFFWRPHMLLYFGIGVTMALAFIALFFLFRQGQGSIRQRFRSNPIIGLLILAGGLLLYVLPADPIWHSIYGEDLTAWGVPHLMLFLAFDSIMLLAIAIHMSKQPRREWKTVRRLNSADLLPLWMFAAMSLTLNQFFTTEWDGGATFAQTRPEWLLPMLIVVGAALVGVLANHTLRMVGAATLSGILALAVRLELIQLFQAGDLMRANAWVLALPSLVLIDLWYAYRSGKWVGAGIAAAAGMVAMVLLVFAGFYPNNPITNLPITILMVTTGSLGLSWLGAALGDYLSASNKQLEVAGEGFRSQLVSLVLVAVFVSFVIFFVTTASPPL